MSETPEVPDWLRRSYFVIGILLFIHGVLLISSWSVDVRATILLWTIAILLILDAVRRGIIL